MQVFFALIFATMGIGHAKLKFPDVAKGSKAVARVFRGAVVPPFSNVGTQNMHSSPKITPRTLLLPPLVHKCPRTKFQCG